MEVIGQPIRFISDETIVITPEDTSLVDSLRRELEFATWALKRVLKALDNGDAESFNYASDIYDQATAFASLRQQHSILLWATNSHKAVVNSQARSRSAQ